MEPCNNSGLGMIIDNMPAPWGVEQPLSAMPSSWLDISKSCQNNTENRKHQPIRPEWTRTLRGHTDKMGNVAHGVTVRGLLFQDCKYVCVGAYIHGGAVVRRRHFWCLDGAKIESVVG